MIHSDSYSTTAKIQVLVLWVSECQVGPGIRGVWARAYCTPHLSQRGYYQQRTKALSVWFVCDVALTNAARSVFCSSKHGAPACSGHPTDGETLASLGSRETKRSLPGRLRCCSCKQCPTLQGITDILIPTPKHAMLKAQCLQQGIFLALTQI